jgi:hypothetical protein
VINSNINLGAPWSQEQRFTEAGDLQAMQCATTRGRKGSGRSGCFYSQGLDGTGLEAITRGFQALI